MVVNVKQKVYSMDKLINGSTLYDVLAAIIPGYLICLLLRILIVPQDYVVRGVDGISLTIFIFVVSYLVGLLFKALCEFLSASVLRNKPSRIRKACKKAEIDKVVKDKILAIKEDDQLLRLYYQNYYIAVNHNANSSIGTLEVQVAFVRSMIVIILGYILSLSKIMDYDLGCKMGLTLAIFLFLLDVFICILIFHLQYRLHRLVWEDSFYIELTKQNT